jgi:hypothetical protein
MNIFEVERWDAMLNGVVPLSSTPQIELGWLAYLGPSYRCTCLSGYTDLEWVLAEWLWGPRASALTKSSTSGACNEEGCGLLADS